MKRLLKLQLFIKIRKSDQYGRGYIISCIDNCCCHCHGGRHHQYDHARDSIE